MPERMAERMSGRAVFCGVIVHECRGGPTSRMPAALADCPGAKAGHARGAPSRG